VAAKLEPASERRTCLGGRSIVVAVNAGDTHARLSLEIPELAGHLIEQVSWSGRDWGSSFAPNSLGAGPLEVELEAREGLVVEAAPL